MELKEFIKKLKKIEKKNGNLIEVKMADYIPVKKIIISSDIQDKKCVVITDQK